MTDQQTDIDEKAAMQIVANTYRHLYEELLYKVHIYFKEEIEPRGDQGMIREYKKHFGITCLLWAMLIPAMARNYYFSSTSGNDDFPGTIEQPFHSTDRLNKIYAKPGDKLLLKSGDYFYGGITTRNDGTREQAITISTYGGSTPAVINGFVIPSGWTNIGNGIWRSDTFPAGAILHNVVMDNRQVEQGRYPNEDSVGGGFLPTYGYISGPLTTTVYCSLLAAWGIDSSWTGAMLKIKGYISALENCPITAISGNKLTFDNRNMFWQVGYTPSGFFLTNHIKTLDLPGEWYYNPKEHRLYMYFAPGDSPANHTIEASGIDVLFMPHNSYWKVDNIVFRGANTYAISCNWKGRKGLTLNNFKILQTGVTAIAMAGICGLNINHFTIDGCGTNGIVTTYQCDSTRITNGTISNVGMLVSNIWCDSLYQKRMGFGIFSGSCLTKGLHMENVTVNNTAYCGVYMEGSNNYIYRNAFLNTCMKLDDGGAIYYYGSARHTGVNTIIRRNIIVNCPGNHQGFLLPYPIPDAIFIDDNGANILADSNYVQGSGQSCVYVHNAANCTFRDNIFTDARVSLFEAQDDGKGGRVQGLNVRYNYFLPANASQFVYRLCATGNGSDNTITRFGIIDNNYVVIPQKNYLYAHTDTFNFPGIRDYQFGAFQRTMPYDKQSKAVATETRIVRTFYALERDSVIYLGGTWSTLEGRTVKGSITLKDHTGILLIQ
jgi:hypothetical protein